MAATDRKKSLKQLRVLYMHGLEMDSEALTRSYLAQNCKECCIPEMEVSTWRLDRRRSVMRMILAQRRACAVLVSCLVGAVMLCMVNSYFWPYPGIVGLLLGLYWIDRDYISITQKAVRTGMRGCVEDVMALALKRFEPDVVVAWSWGGAVGTCCIEMGVWNGPTVLLAPAYHRVVRAMGGPLGPGLKSLAVKPKGVLVVHSGDDGSIPYSDSRHLVAQLGGPPGVQLVEVAGGGHALASLMEEPGAHLGMLIEEAYRRHWGVA